jgi:cytochrome b6-f complex iron-sulfur subunit
MENDTPQFQASRRRVMLAGSASVLGVATLAACGSDDDGSSATVTTPVGAGADTTNEPITLIALDKVPDGGAVAVSAAGLNLIVSRPTGGEPVAMTSVCPHQGCKVVPQDAKLVCPCHQSIFELDGAKVSGPTTTGLPTYTTEVKDGQIVLTSTEQQKAK